MFKTLKKMIQNMRAKNHEAYRSGSNMFYESDNAVPIRDISYNQPTQWTTFDSQTNAVTMGATTPAIGGGSKTEPAKDVRIEAKPVEVVKEIITEVPSMMLDDIRKQIKIVQKRMRILKEQSIEPRDEKEALGYLQARRVYKKRSKLFTWTITTNEKISELCKKYKLRRVGFKGYYKTVPTEALDELERFVNACHKIRNGAPEIELIIDDGGKETRRDPIMFANSPFGRWFYILGAWDKEIEVVGELIYNAK